MRVPFSSIKRTSLVGILLGVSACQECDPILEKLPYCQQISQEDSPPVDICNSFDDDCDGTIDEDCDVDKDGYCPSSAQYQDCPTPDSVLGCTAPKTDLRVDTLSLFERYCPGLAIDCDDADAAIHPGAIEYCDGKDNNCEQGIDESFPEYNTICTNFPDELDGIGICKTGTWVCGSHEERFGYEPRLFCEGKGPLEETCNGTDDDCNSIPDDGAAQAEQEECFHELVRNPDGSYTLLVADDQQEEAMRDHRGPCRGGVATCTTYCPPDRLADGDCVEGIIGGDMECYGAYVPKQELCDGNGVDEDCDGVVDNGFDSDGDTYSICAYPQPDCDDDDPDSYPNALETLCDGKDQNCDGVDDVGTDEDMDSFSVELACSDPSDCNDARDDIYPGAQEKCDCEDNDCDGDIDEDLSLQDAVDISYGIDCSGSMLDNIDSIIQAYTDGQLPSCFSQDVVKMSTTYIADFFNKPVLVRNLATPSEFSSNFAADIPSSCSGNEPSLDFIVYNLCALPSMASHPVCVELESDVRAYLDDPNQPGYNPRQIWRDGSQKTIVFVGDEHAQTEHYNLVSLGGGNIDQVVVADMVRQSGVRVNLFVREPYINFADPTDPDSFGSIVLDGSGNCAGKIYNLSNSVGSLRTIYENDVIDSYCNDSPSTHCEEE